MGTQYMPAPGTALPVRSIVANLNPSSNMTNDELQRMVNQALGGADPSAVSLTPGDPSSSSSIAGALAGALNVTSSDIRLVDVVRGNAAHQHECVFVWWLL